MKKDALHIGVCLGLFILFRYLFSVATVEEVNFLLWPVDKIISICLDSSSEFIPGKGYYHPALHMIIEKSCSGGTFLSLAFFMTSFVCIHKKAGSFLFIIPASLLFSYLLTLLANTGRIIGYLLVHQIFLTTVSPGNESLYHTIIGLVVYLTFLIVYYMLLNQYVLNKKISTHEEAS